MDIISAGVEFAKHNQFLSGGAVLGLTTLLFNRVKSLPSLALMEVRNQVFYTLTLEWRKDSGYHEKVLAAVEKYAVEILRSRRTKTSRYEVVPVTDALGLELKAPRKATFFGGWFESRPFWITLNDPIEDNGENPTDFIKNFHNTTKPRSISIRFLTLDKNLPSRFLKQFTDRSHYDKPVEGMVYIQQFSAQDSNSFYRLKRRLNTLKYGFSAEEIKDKITAFTNSEYWYTARGIPYHLGVLLYGPPGNGKTNFILSLASELNLNIRFINLEGMRSERLASIAQGSGGAIIVIEDIDAFYNQREESEDTKITLSSILNVLDGINSQPGQIVIMTSNHIEKLDPALIRPGRIDISIEVGNATTNQAREYFKYFYSQEGDAEAVRFAANVSDGQYSMAQIQGHLMRFKDSPAKAAIANIGVLDTEE